ncbi:MAG: hypothetical protein ACLQDQ_15370 [Myxococcaceae bacterium]
MDKRSSVLALTVVGLVSGLALPGCLESSTLVCMGGTVQCNVTCVYLNADPDNCGACGNACQPRAVCVPIGDGGLGQCECPQGIPLADGGTTILLCNGTCTDITTDPRNCGGCAGAGGTVCGNGLVCAPNDAGGGICEANCGSAVECNGSCVALDTDNNNCGACGNVCAQGYSCHPTPSGTPAGACLPDLVVACNGTPGSVAPLFDSAVQPVAGPGVPAGTLPGGLGLLGTGLLVADDSVLTELALQNLALVAPESPPLGSGPDFLEVDSRSDAGSWVYVVNGTGNTLSILSGPPAANAQVLLPDGGVQGLGLLNADGGYAFGQNTFPEPYARVGNQIYVPLYGGESAATASAGGTVVLLDLTNPTVPVPVGTYDLNGIALQTFDGGVSFPRPSQAFFHNGFVYVVLNNLDINYDSAGPSLLVKIDPTQPPDAGVGSISQLVTLDAGVCLNAVSMAESEGRLLVSCAGQAVFDPVTFATLAVNESAVLLLDVNDTLLASWSPQCPDAGPACTPPIAGPLTQLNGRAYVGDSSSGRVFVLNVTDDGQLTELVGYGPDGGLPLQPCPAGISSVSDILSIP